MGSMNVLILNVYNIYQEQSGWNGRLREKGSRQVPTSQSFENVIELSPKDGVWQADAEEMLSLEPHNPCLTPHERLTYNRQGGFASRSSTGARINLVV